jgi:hypothetical protein
MTLVVHKLNIKPVKLISCKFDIFLVLQNVTSFQIIFNLFVYPSLTTRLIQKIVQI